MSLQDDYYDLEHSLRGENKKRMQRIWETFCEMEREYYKLEEIVNCFKKSIRLAFEDENADSGNKEENQKT